MKIKSGKMLPKTADEIHNGGVYVQHVRCGKSNCKCATGERHIAFYFFTRRAGKLVKIYIRKEEFAAFAEIVNQATAERTKNRKLRRESNAILKRLRESVRDFEQIKKLYQENYNNEQKLRLRKKTAV